MTCDHKCVSEYSNPIYVSHFGLFYEKFKSATQLDFVDRLGRHKRDKCGLQSPEAVP